MQSMQTHARNSFSIQFPQVVYTYRETTLTSVSNMPPNSISETKWQVPKTTKKDKYASDVSLDSYDDSSLYHNRNSRPARTINGSPKKCA
jgi:hypothetical protein